MSVDKSFADRDQKLLKQIANGDEEAFAELFHAWRDKLYFFILRIVNDSESAEDIVQDIFVKLWQNRSTLTHIEHFSS